MSGQALDLLYQMCDRVDHPKDAAYNGDGMLLIRLIPIAEVATESVLAFVCVVFRIWYSSVFSVRDSLLVGIRVRIIAFLKRYYNDIIRAAVSSGFIFDIHPKAGTANFMRGDKPVFVDSGDRFIVNFISDHTRRIFGINLNDHLELLAGMKLGDIRNGIGLNGIVNIGKRCNCAAEKNTGAKQRRKDFFDILFHIFLPFIETGLPL